MAQFDQWAGFSGKNWKNSVDVRDFIQENYTPYDGDESFLEGPTEATDKLWEDFRSCRKRNVQKAAFLTWRQKLYPVLQHPARDISTRA